MSCRGYVYPVVKLIKNVLCLLDEQRRKYSKMDKRAKDKLVRSPRENGGG
jgi:hypothetical protein